MTTLYENFIDGRFVPADPATAIDVHNPASHVLLARTASATPDEVNAAVDAARRAQPAWERTPAIQRAGHLRAIAAKVRQNKERLAEIITREQGKILGLALVEVDFTADYIDYMAEWARRIEGEVLTSDRAGGGDAGQQGVGGRVMDVDGRARVGHGEAAVDEVLVQGGHGLSPFGGGAGGQAGRASFLPTVSDT